MLLLSGIGRACEMVFSDNVVVHQVIDDHRYLVLQRHFVRVQMNLGVNRRFIRVVDAGEILDLASTSFLVQALGVTRFCYLECAIDENLNKFEIGSFMQTCELRRDLPCTD